jgi:hypothetical protein
MTESSLFTDEQLAQTDLTPVDIWATPPTHTQQDGAVKVWSFDKKSMPEGLAGRINVSEWPNAATVKNLDEVLHPSSEVPQRFFWSPKACSGILRRAEKRGKTLPKKLKEAVEYVASLENADNP